jgi:hypothetical protein
MTDLADGFQPEAGAQERYDRLFGQVYRPLFPTLQPQLQRLSRLRAELA